MTQSFLLFIFVFFLSVMHSFAATETVDSSHPKTLDGVYIQAVETYINSNKNEVSFGVGIYPIDAFYNGFSGNLSYARYFGNTIAWEVINASMAFSVQKDLTTQLAKKYSVDPATIEQLELVATTGLNYTFSYGKSVLFKSILQYSRSSLLIGLGMVKTTVQSRISGMLGYRFDGHINDTFSWRFEIRDNITINGFEHFPSFSLGTGVYF